MMEKEKTLDELLTVVPKINDLRLSASRVVGFINNGPKTLLERKKIDNEGILMGGLIDCLLYEPDLFKSKYHVGDIKKPTASTLVLADFLLKEVVGDNWTPVLPDFEDEDGDIGFTNEVLKAINEVSIKLGLWSRSTAFDVRIGKFYNEDFVMYLKETLEAKDKTLITAEQHILALEVIDILKNHKHSKYLFKNDLENYYQFKTEFEYNNFKFLGYIDHIQIDHNLKTICAKDLKTGTPKGGEFLNSFLKYKYYIQGALYQIALGSIKKELKCEDYEILPFEFVYISRFEKIPMIYTMDDKWLKGAIEGFTTNRGIKYPGLDKTLLDIEWHLKNDVFNMSRYISEANGLLTLNSDIIEV